MPTAFWTDLVDLLKVLVASQHIAFDKLVLDPPAGWVIPVYPDAQPRTGRVAANCGAYQTPDSPARVAAWYDHQGMTSQLVPGGGAIHGVGNFHPPLVSVPFTGQKVWLELDGILRDLRNRDPDFEADLRLLFARPPYELEANHPLADAIGHIAERVTGRPPTFGGMSFWTDAAVMGEAGIPSVLYGPGGAGLHSIEEYVVLHDVLTCRDVLASLARHWCGRI